MHSVLSVCKLNVPEIFYFLLLLVISIFHYVHCACSILIINNNRVYVFLVINDRGDSTDELRQKNDVNYKCMH